MRSAKLLCTLALLMLPLTTAFAQTGKIAGLVTDAGTGEPLPGVNVAIEGTTQGAVTDVNGYYAILNVRPGTYNVRASFIGYTPVVRENVRVNIDLTTELDFQLQEETVGLQEIVVAAERPVVQRDISASMANISAEEIENLPVTSVAEVIGLQAGFEPGLTIRGAGGDQVAFVVDGMSYTDPRANTPFTGISYTSIEEVQVQTGGFNAEYGNVRSGLINVVTKDGPRDRYTADVLLRYSSPSKKYFGPRPNSEEAYWTRPYLDPEVAFEGTSKWPEPLRRQYPEFQGWNAVAEAYNAGRPASEHLTPQQLQDVFRHYIRKDFEIDNPTYELDATIGGPVPGISRYLGDLRFIASYRETQNPYIVPQHRELYEDRAVQGKLTADIATGMKLTVSGLYGEQSGLTNVGDGAGGPSMFNGETPKYPWDGRGYLMANALGNGATRPPRSIYNDWEWGPMDVERTVFGAQFTHTLSPNTFYEVQLQRNSSDYLTGAPPARTNEVIATIGDFELTDAPFGYEPKGGDAPFNFGLQIGGHGGSARDTSNVSRWQMKFDITSQLNRYMQVKSGVEYVISDYDIARGEYDPFFVHHANPKFRWNRSPSQGALYAQTKLEFQGMIANLGLRADYFHAGGEWYVYEPFDRALTATAGAENLDENLEQEPVDPKLALSPRLGVSFPVTENSKLYFNYGHFRQMLEPRRLYEVAAINTGRVDEIGDPNQPLPKTVAYELGFEQNIADMFLLRLAGFYRDLSLQPQLVRYVSIDQEVNYARVQPFNYGDFRGFELTLQKNRGAWVRGFVNYTYLSRKTGNFGYNQYFESRLEQRRYEAGSGARDIYQSKPIPEPFARLNLEVVVPEDFGPDVAGVNLLGDWRVNFLGEWRAGQKLTWTGQQLTPDPGISRQVAFNTSWKDYYMLDMRLSKNFRTQFADLQFFVDITNVLNLKHLYRSAPFQGDPNDALNYYRSLHMSDDTFPDDYDPGYVLVPGDDQPGDYRDPDVDFVPIVGVRSLPESGDQHSLYYLAEENGGGSYFEWNGSAFVPADQSRVDRVLDDKAYIDNPNNISFLFLNPRDVFFGLRLSF